MTKDWTSTTELFQSIQHLLGDLGVMLPPPTQCVLCWIIPKWKPTYSADKIIIHYKIGMPDVMLKRKSLAEHWIQRIGQQI